METAGKEESRLAKEKGDVDSNGIPLSRFILMAVGLREATAIVITLLLEW